MSFEMTEEGLARAKALFQEFFAKQHGEQIDTIDRSEKGRDPLEGFRAQMFRPTSYPGMDALVAVISKEQEGSPEVKQTLDTAGEGRWYPVEGGWKVMCPYAGQRFNRDLFHVEKGAWSHAHCDGCQNSIDRGASCWMAETQNDFLVICDECHDRLKKNRGDG